MDEYQKLNYITFNTLVIDQINSFIQNINSVEDSEEDGNTQLTAFFESQFNNSNTNVEVIQQDTIVVEEKKQITIVEEVKPVVEETSKVIDTLLGNIKLIKLIYEPKKYADYEMWYNTNNIKYGYWKIDDKKFNDVKVFSDYDHERLILVRKIDNKFRVINPVNKDVLDRLEDSAIHRAVQSEQRCTCSFGITDSSCLLHGW